MKQGTEEWKLARCGKITASKIADLLAMNKSGYAASRKNYLADLLVERMTGTPTDSFVSSAMQWGTEYEPEARAIYEFVTGQAVWEVGFIIHPKYDFSGASPDGLIDPDGMIEIKCPITATHIETLLTGAVPKNYYAQIQWGLECTGRQWCDYVSYDPRMKDEDLVLFRKRIDRDEDFLAGARIEVEKAEKELQTLIEQVKAIK